MPCSRVNINITFYPVGYDKDSHPTSTKTFPHLVFWLPGKEDKLYPWAN